MTFAIKAVGHARGGRAETIGGTPAADIKPVLGGFPPRGDVREPAWAGAIMETHG